MIVKKIYEPILTADVIFIFDCKVKELENWYKRKNLVKEDSYDLLSGAVTDYVDKDKYKYYIIWIENKKDFYTLFHESIHLVRRIMVDRNVPFNETNDEFIAYYETFWFKKLWRIMSKNRKI
jgi:hypothetical protein